MILALVGSCSAPAPPPLTDERTSTIFGGSPDTSHLAVMALVNQAGGACSGTAISVSGRFGVLLTAAHCVVAVDGAGNIITPIQPAPAEDLFVVPGDDWAVSFGASTYYPVQEYVLHPSYTGVTGNTFDIAVVRFVGATAATPTIPALASSEDDLAVGTPLAFVGYGQTQTNSTNTVRHRVNRNVASLTARTVTHSRADGRGICQGDSGGPALRTTAMGERVAAVSSYSQGASCATGSGVSIRVSAFDSFIQSFLAATPPAVECTTCRVLAGTVFGGCPSEAIACTNGTACAAFLGCASACPTGDTACQQQCGSQEPQGQLDYGRLFTCACDTACAVECATEPACDVPACGLEFADVPCNDCNEARCCAETTACANDVACRTCATSMMRPASCDADALYRAFRNCNFVECKDACGSGCGFGNTGACGDCIQGTCCDEASVCFVDATCFACATGSGNASTCSATASYGDLLNCLGSCPADPCGTGVGAGGTGGGAAGAAGAAGLGESDAGHDAGGGTGGSVGGRAGASVGGSGFDGGAATPGDPAPSPGSDGGCGCRVRGSSRSFGGLAALVALWGLAVLGRKRTGVEVRSFGRR